MVDRRRQILEEPLQGNRIGGVEGRCALRAEFQRRLLEPAGISSGEDDFGALSAGASSCLKPDACAAADHHDCLSGKFRFVADRNRSSCAGHDSSDGWRRRPKHPVTGSSHTKCPSARDPNRLLLGPPSLAVSQVSRLRS
jgi:hypothetical protein